MKMAIRRFDRMSVGIESTSNKTTPAGLKTVKTAAGF